MLGALNIMDQPGAYASMETQSVTTNGTTAITATGIGSTHFGAVPNEWVAIYGAGPTPSVSTPTGINVSAMSTATFSAVFPPGPTENTSFRTGCNVIDATGSITSGDNHLFVNNDALYEVGNTITVPGAGPTSGNLTTTVTATTKRTNGGDYYTLAANASTTVTAAAVTGGNCTTTRLYRVRAVDALGGMSPPTAPQPLTNTANALNWQNFISFQVNTQGELADVLEGCEGAACSSWQIIDLEVPTYTFATPSFSFPYLDALLPTNNGTKTAPVTITLHDFGLGYGTDYNQGSTLPSGAVNQILFTKLNSVSANAAVLANAATQTGTFTMVHDIGPAINSAIVQATTPVGSTGRTVPIMIPAAPQGDGYSLVTGIYANYTNNLQILSYTNLIDVDTSQADCITQGSCWNMLNYRGPLGGTAVSIQNSNNANIQHLGVNALTTMGVCFDLDETFTYTGETTTAPNIDGMSCGQASVGYRLANINPSNVEFGSFKHINFNAINSSGVLAPGGIGILLNSGNSLRHGCYECGIGGQIGVYNIGSMQFDGGQIGDPNGISVWTPPYVADEIVLRNLRMEGISRAFYAPASGSTIGENGPEFDTVQVTYFKNMPDGIAFAIPGAGQTKILHSRFAAAAGLGGSDLWAGTNAFYSLWLQGFSTLFSDSNKYPGNISNPFTALPLGSAAVPQVISLGDLYANTANFGFQQPLPALAYAPPTSNEIQSPCPFSINKARGYKYRSDCGMSPGQIIAFPVDETIGNNWGSFDINLYGSIVCHYDYGNAS